MAAASSVKRPIHAGANSAAFHGLFIHYIVGLWLTPAGYVLIYFFLPVTKASATP